MAESLLAHLYSKIRGSQEDIATFSLQYLLSQSKDINKSFTEFCSNCLNIQVQTKLQYICQSVGENNDRPDLVGINNYNNECILCEMKFYAGLTDNQPLTYLDRLNKENQNGLLFICPETRITLLWSELCNRCTDNGRHLLHINKHCVEVDNVKMAITTWTEILNHLELTTNKYAPKYSSDLQQLIGYCKQMDKEAFIPFASNELSQDNAIKALRFYDVIDETTNLILSDKKLKSNPVGKANPYYRGYERKFSINNYIVCLAYDLRLWKSNNSISTPFWIAICDKNKE